MTKEDAKATEQQIDPAAGYSEPDTQGHRYKTERVGKQTRVYLMTETGEAFNTLAATEAEGKKALLAHLSGK